MSDTETTVKDIYVGIGTASDHDLVLHCEDGSRVTVPKASILKLVIQASKAAGRVVVTDEVLYAVREERAAQTNKWGEQHHPDGLDAPLGADLETLARATLEGSVTWNAILLEEVGEAMQAQDPEHLCEELVQVAAVAVAWVEDLDSRVAASLLAGAP